MINKLDFLSPPITLFYLERRTHTSKIGGLLIILLISLCSSYIIYLLYLIIKHKKVTALFYKKFENDIGQYYLNPNSIFYFIQLHSIDNESFKYIYASKYIRTYSYYGNTDFDESSLDRIDHWVYDTCREGIDNKDLDPSLFQNINNFNNSACLRYYFNSKEKKYYSIGEKEYIWPFLEHGIAQKNNRFLHTSMQKCTNDSVINNLFGDCPSQEEIDEYIAKLAAIFMYLVDKQIDPTDYKKPIQNYMQSITSGIGTAESFEENYVFYSPLKLRTKEGTILERNKELNSIFFDSNIKISSPNSKQYFKLARFTQFLQNNIQIYERRYDDITDILSDLGGIIQCVFNIFYWINFLYNKYIIVSDTNSLFFTMLTKRADSINGEKIITKFNKSINKNNNLNNSSFNDLNANKNNNTVIGNLMDRYNDNSHYNGIGNFREENDSKINGSSSKSKENNTKKEKHFSFNLIHPKKYKRNISLFNSVIRNNSFKKKNNNNNNINNTNDIHIVNKMKELHYHSSTNKKSYYLNNNRKKNFYFNHDNIKEESNLDISKNNLVNQTIKLSQYFNDNIKLNKKYSFYNFLKSIFSQKINNINFLIKYRKCLLSEEHVLKSHINNIILEKKLNVDKYQDISFIDSFNE